VLKRILAKGESVAGDAMPKQETAEPSPQQLLLDLKIGNPSRPPEPAPRVTTFVDSTTKAIRQQALTRVKNAGIFALPKAHTK
jgi:hypothetical protein